MTWWFFLSSLLSWIGKFFSSLFPARSKFDFRFRLDSRDVYEFSGHIEKSQLLLFYQVVKGEKKIDELLKGEEKKKLLDFLPKKGMDKDMEAKISEIGNSLKEGKSMLDIFMTLMKLVSEEEVKEEKKQEEREEPIEEISVDDPDLKASLEKMREEMENE